MWTTRQKAILQMYRRYSGISDEDYREMLYRESGQTSSTAFGLTNYHYDRIMALIETRAHLAHVNGMGEGPVPPKISDWRYWRKRCPSLGQINTRQRARVYELWLFAARFLDEPQRTPGYMLAVVGQANDTTFSCLDDLSEAQAQVGIEALKALGARLAAQASRIDLAHREEVTPMT